MRAKHDEPMKVRFLPAALLLLSALAAAAPQHLSHGRFKDLAVYSPAGTPASFVLLLSGEEGWNGGADVLAAQLAQQGAMVVGIDLPKFEGVLKADGSQCEGSVNSHVYTPGIGSLPCSAVPCAKRCCQPRSGLFSWGFGIDLTI